MLGVLLYRYQQLEDEDRDAQHIIIASLEKRWSKVDQDVFIAAVILHPIYKSSPFARGLFTPAKARELLRRLWRRFYNKEPPANFNDDVSDYLKSRNDYASFAPNHEDMKTAKSDLVRQFYCSYSKLSADIHNCC